MALPALREKKVGPFTVRELSMRKNLECVRTHADNSERSIAMLGQAVYNGSGEPIGTEAVLDLGVGWFNTLSEALREVSERPAAPDEEARAEGNG